MVAMAIALVVAAVLGYLVWKRSEPRGTPDVDPEKAVKAALELYKIRSRFDASLIKSEQRRDAARLRRQLAEILKDDD